MTDHVMGTQAWQTLVELPPRVWMESVQLVYDYFCERTPRSFVEARDTSVVWNYRYAGAPNSSHGHASPSGIL